MTRPTTLPEPWADLAHALGSVAELADACGVTARTVHRWADGEREPSVLQKRDVRERLRRRGLRAPW